MQLQRFAFTSGIHGKEPVDTLEFAESGRRVWAHFALRNRSGLTRKMTLSFSVNGQKRTTFDLKVEPSWSFRTWAYVTLRKTDTDGEIVLDATDDDGAVITHARLPIKPQSTQKKRKP